MALLHQLGEHLRSHKSKWRKQMTRTKVLSAALILSATFATPVFARDHGQTHVRHFRGAYNQMIGPSYYAAPYSQSQRNLEDFGFSGRDPSRPGGMDPNLNPPS
jgi:hypothetical protein